MATQPVPVDPSDKKKRHRSPNYPYVGLRQAVARLGKLYEKDGKAGAPPELAAVHIGFGSAHGEAMSVLSALKKFGLLGESDGRLVPTQRALVIVNLPEADPRRKDAIREAVMEPPLYRELIEKHRTTGWPAQDVLASELVTYRNFNPNVSSGLVVDLMDSIEFAGLSEGDALESAEETEEMPIAELEQTTTAPQDLAKKIAKKIVDAQEISLPVGISEDGEVIFAHVRFDGGIKKNLIANLRGLLEAMEKPLP